MEKEKQQKEAHARAVKKYREKNEIYWKINLNKNTDKDIIDWLASLENQRGTIKELIRKEIKKAGSRK